MYVSSALASSSVSVTLRGSRSVARSRTLANRSSLRIASRVSSSMPCTVPNDHDIRPTCPLAHARNARTYMPPGSFAAVRTQRRIAQVFVSGDAAGCGRFRALSAVLRWPAWMTARAWTEVPAYDGSHRARTATSTCRLRTNRGTLAGMTNNHEATNEHTYETCHWCEDASTGTADGKPCCDWHARYVPSFAPNRKADA